MSSKQHHQNQPQVRTLSNLRPLACVNGAVSFTPPASASVNNIAAFMLLNPHSLNNKALLIHDIITDRKIDFLCLTETWQHQQDFLTLNQATLPGYVYIQKRRSKRHGGGLAVIHRTDILVKQLPVLNVTSFECAAFSLAGHTQLQVVLIYRPPKASSTFMSKLSELLTSICSMSASTLLFGDFNMHVDSTSCPFASEFLLLLDCFNITQHVKGPTLRCLDLTVSDHYAVLFTVSVPVPKQRISPNITYGNIKTVNTLALTNILESP